MKKRFKIITALSFILTAAAISASAEIMYVANVDNAVYLRTAPASDSYYQILPLGTRVDSIGWQRGADGEGYNQVIYNGVHGWIKTCYLSNINYTPSVNYNDNYGGDLMRIANVANSVYLRTAPASDSYYCTIPLGTVVKSIGWQRGADGEGYNQVVYNGVHGWVKTCYLAY